VTQNIFNKPELLFISNQPKLTIKHFLILQLAALYRVTRNKLYSTEPQLGHACSLLKRSSFDEWNIYSKFPFDKWYILKPCLTIEVLLNSICDESNIFLGNYSIYLSNLVLMSRPIIVFKISFWRIKYFQILFWRKNYFFVLTNEIFVDSFWRVAGLNKWSRTD